MSNKDKQNIVVLAIIMVLIGSAIGSFYAAQFLPFEILVIVCAVMECLFLMPKLISVVYEIFEGQDAGMWKWLPIINEVLLFGGTGTKVCIGTLILSGVCAIFALVPVSSVGVLAFLIDYKYRLLFASIVLLLVFITERFIFMMKLQEDIYAEYYRIYDNRPKNNMLMILLSPIPLIRGAYISYLLQIAQSVRNGISIEEEEYFVEEE